MIWNKEPRCAALYAATASSTNYISAAAFVIPFCSSPLSSCLLHIQRSTHWIAGKSLHRIWLAQPFRRATEAAKVIVSRYRAAILIKMLPPRTRKKKKKRKREKKKWTMREDKSRCGNDFINSASTYVFLVDRLARFLSARASEIVYSIFE